MENDTANHFILFSWLGYCKCFCVFLYRWSDQLAVTWYRLFIYLFNIFFCLSLQVKFWSQQISFIVVGIIIVTQIRGLLIKLTKVSSLLSPSYYQGKDSNKVPLWLLMGFLINGHSILWGHISWMLIWFVKQTAYKIKGKSLLLYYLQLSKSYLYCSKE